MKLSLRAPVTVSLSLSLSLAVLAGCSHTTSAVGQGSTLTSSRVPARAPEVSADAVAERGFVASPSYTPDTSAIPTQSDAAPLETWPKSYPDAASELNDWTVHYPVAARKLAAWDARFPERMKTLVDWAITHRYEGVGAFLYGRSGWDQFLDVVQSEPDGVQEYLEWIRRSGPAAIELSSHPEALSWASKNLKPRPGHVPMPAKSIASPASTNEAATPGPRSAGASGGVAPPSDGTSSWFPSPTSMIR
jgi:hypothetical protein